RAQIGGYTGDVLGATEQSAETLVLLCLVAIS
ncbi:MAG: adenosylcobinamide-GDP ribazoletransferase, partial [Alphaproteobacteria bacterium]